MRLHHASTVSARCAVRVGLDASYASASCVTTAARLSIAPKANAASGVMAMRSAHAGRCHEAPPQGRIPRAAPLGDSDHNARNGVRLDSVDEMKDPKPGALRTHQPSGYRRDFKMLLNDRCGACAKEIIQPPGSGRPRKHCGTDRCRAIYYGNHQRTRCARCRSRLAKGRANQRASICGRCFVDLCDLAGLGGRR